MSNEELKEKLKLLKKNANAPKKKVEEMEDIEEEELEEDDLDDEELEEPQIDEVAPIKPKLTPSQKLAHKKIDQEEEQKQIKEEVLKDDKSKLVLEEMAALHNNGVYRFRQISSLIGIKESLDANTRELREIKELIQAFLSN